MEKVVSIPEQLAPPEQVDTAKIEQELEELWREAESSGESVTRATAFNLVYLCARQAESDGQLILPELALSHPTRSILVSLDETKPPAERAWVTANCRRLEGENKQICSEAISLEIDGDATLRAASLIHSLTLGSLSTAVIWHHSLPLSHPLLALLANTVERAITCSVHENAPASSLKPWIEFYQKASDTCVVSDLLWAELSGWRGAVAELFDDCPNAESLREVRIHSTGDKTTAGALLLGAWIAESLKWKTEGIALKGRRPVIECSKDHAIMFIPEGGVSGEGIEFLFDNNNTAAVMREGDNFSLTLHGRTRIARATEQDTKTLLAHELHAWGRDSRLHSALSTAQLWLPKLLFS